MDNIERFVDEKVSLQRLNSQLQKEAAASRQLGLELAETLESVSQERTRMQEENEKLWLQLAEKDAMLGEARAAMRDVGGTLRHIARAVASCVYPDAGNADVAAEAEAAEAADDDTQVPLDVAVGQLREAAHHTQGLGEQLVLSDAALRADRTRPPSEQARALEAKIAYLRGKLDNLPVLELENNRLRRVLNSKRYKDAGGSPATNPASPPGAAASPADARAPLLDAKPDAEKLERLRAMSCSPPTIIRMPGYEEYNVNDKEWPVRSIGVQCGLLQAPAGANPHLGGFAAGESPARQMRSERESAPAESPLPYGAGYTSSSPTMGGGMRRSSPAPPPRGISPVHLRMFAQPPSRGGRPPTSTANTYTSPSPARGATPNRRARTPRSTRSSSKTATKPSATKHRASPSPVPLLRPT